MAEHGARFQSDSRERSRVLEVPLYAEVFNGETGNSVKDSRHWEEHLVFGSYAMNEILKEVQNARWQRERVRMLGTSAEFKWNVLRSYLVANAFSRHARVVVTNYVYALKRGGVIK